LFYVDKSFLLSHYSVSNYRGVKEHRKQAIRIVSG
jgi:hypothetical protein